jgi:hypothetical protein
VTGGLALALALAAVLAAGCGSRQAGAAAAGAASVVRRPGHRRRWPGRKRLGGRADGRTGRRAPELLAALHPPGRPGRLAARHPEGVADNGGLVVAAGRRNGALVTGFVPSQDLTFSPLASSTDDGVSWSPGLADGGLAGLPGALADAPDGRLLAILASGAAELSAPGGTSWTQLTSERWLAATPAGRACGLVRLSSAAFGPWGEPLLAGQCAGPGAAGIFGYIGGSWRPAGPALPAAPAPEQIDVVRLVSTSTGETALLAAGTGGDESLFAGWLSGRGGGWTLSPPFRMGASQLRSASFGRSGAVANCPERGARADPRRTR